MHEFAAIKKLSLEASRIATNLKISLPSLTSLSLKDNSDFRFDHSLLNSIKTLETDDVMYAKFQLGEMALEKVVID